MTRSAGPGPSSTSRPRAQRPRRIAVVGGGISGLSAAYYLSREDPGAQVTVLESSEEWGGIVLTEHRRGFVMEGGPDAFLTLKPETARLCRSLGLQDQLMETRPRHRRSYTWAQGRLHPLPTQLLNPPVSLSELRRSPLLSPEGRERAAQEPDVQPGRSEDESVGDFFRRRFGEEVVRRIAEPLLAGVFGGRVEEISMQAAFPRLYDYEQRHGRLGVDQPSPSTGQEDSGPRPSAFQTLRGGLGTLIAALADSCRGSGVELRLSCPVRKIESPRPAEPRRGGPAGASADLARPRDLDLLGPQDRESGYTLITRQGRERFDALIVAVPAPVAGRLLEDNLPEASRLLASITYSPAVLGALAYREPVLPPLEGSGFIVPPSAGRPLLACTWVHQKWNHRAPQGHSLLRGYLAGEPARRLLEAEEKEITDLLRNEFRHLMDIDQAPLFSPVWKLPLALPAYRLGHRQRIRALQGEIANSPGLHCIGNYWDGVGLSDCIRHASRAAARLASKPAGERRGAGE